ncbi:MAG: sensor histidine kinase [Symbiobacteriia bacterium]
MEAQGTSLVEIAALDRVLKETVRSLEKGKEQIFEIAEAARDEYRTVQRDVERLKNDVYERIREVDQLERRDQQARVRLMEVSRDFHKYSEEDVKDAYDRAREVQVSLSAARAAEAALRAHRDSLERRLQALQVMVARADGLVNNVASAMGFLTGSLRNLSVHVEGIKQRRDLGLAIIKAQEEERRRVAREIHDGPAQLLANVVLRIDVCQRLADTDLKRLKDELHQLKDLVRMSLQDVRKVIFDLRPMALDDLGLVPALRSYLKDYQERSGVIPELTVQGEERRFSQAFEVALFRLVQEALNNVWKHAQAKTASVVVEFHGDSLRVLVRDDGVGFDLERARAEGSRFGLISMRERAELLQGKLQVDTAVGQGTRVSFHIPYPEEELM